MFVICGFDSAVSAMDVLIVHGIILVDGVRRCVADRPRLIVNDQGIFKVYYLRRSDYHLSPRRMVRRNRDRVGVSRSPERDL
jgi:hypothetical protein